MGVVDMTDQSKMKLGRRAIKWDTRTLYLMRYLMPNLPAAPAERDWTQGRTDWGMMMNSEIGDCTIAACGHAVQTWSLNSVGLELPVPDSSILSAYEQWCGYSPANPSTDQGGIELDVLTQWKNSSLNGHALLGFTSLFVTNLETVRQAINIFGGVYIGISLPLSAQNQAVWDVTRNPGWQPGSWGGHAVWVPAYDQNGFTCITWGGLQRMTNAFWSQYVDESYALLGVPWMSSHGAPSGLDLEQLQADLAAIR